MILVGALVALALLGIAALVVITLLRDDDPNLLAEAPAIPATTPASSATSTPAAAGTAALPSGALHFAIESSGSQGGSIRVEGTVGAGSTFTFSLPLRARGAAPDHKDAEVKS